MPQMIVRNPDFDLASLDLTRDWLNNDGFRSQFFNALSMSFPVGEGFFISTLRDALPHLCDPSQIAAIQQFIQQEANHSRLHLVLNKRLEQSGLRNIIDALGRWRIRRSRHWTVLNKLAITIAYEHFTAVLGDLLLTNMHWLDGAAPVMRDLWVWHAVEEMEHRDVAFNAYLALGGGAARRIAWYAYICLVFTLDCTAQIICNLYQSHLIFRFATWHQAGRFLLGKKGVLRQIIPALFDYFRISYHPLDRGDDHLSAQRMGCINTLYNFNS